MNTEKLRLMEGVFAKAGAAQKTITLPEGEDSRVVTAAWDIARQKLAKVVLLGRRDKIHDTAVECGVNIDDLMVVDPATAPDRDEYVQAYYELRKNKGITLDQAAKIIADPLYFGVMMVNAGKADGQVSGAAHSTADTVRPALQVLKTAPGISTVSSFFVIIVPDCDYGEKGLFIYSDAGLVIDPTAEQLAEIAITSARTMANLFDIEPRVAMLSFSTKGSAKHTMVDKVARATEIAKSRAPEIAIDGEMQGDAALVQWIGEKKAPGSPVAGRANVLIFPDIQAGNIAYKLTERLAKAEAYGPVLQGLRKPVNDLSRGCDSNDIVNVAAITAAQALQ